MTRRSRITWEPGQPHPRWANRKTIAAIVTFEFFPVAARTIATWPITVATPNGETIGLVEEAIEHARAKLEAAPKFRQAAG